MNLFSRFFKGRPAAVKPGVWPNNDSWSARRNGIVAQPENRQCRTWEVGCGNLTLPSGRLVACDPFACLMPGGMPHVLAPRGKFPVFVTLVDVSEKQDMSHIREAYASIIFSEATESYRQTLPLLKDGDKSAAMGDGEFIGFSVDAGTACFVDDAVIGPCMPDPQTWVADLFENENPDCWFKLMDNPDHIREGIANLPLPLGKNGENLILFHSGWGDGTYPLIGSFDSQGRLVAAHIDFLVIE